MTEPLTQAEIDAEADRIEALLVDGLTALREGRAADAIMLLKEARESAERLPKKDRPWAR